MNKTRASALLRYTRNVAFTRPRLQWAQRSHIHLLHEIASRPHHLIGHHIARLERPVLPPLTQPINIQHPPNSETRSLSLREAVKLIEPGSALVPVTADENSASQKWQPRPEAIYHIVPLNMKGVEHLGRRAAKRAGRANEVHMTATESLKSMKHKLSTSHRLLGLEHNVEVHVRFASKPIRDPYAVAREMSNSLHLHPAAIFASMPEGSKRLGDIFMDRNTGGVILLLLCPGWPGMEMNRIRGRVRNYLMATANLFPALNRDDVMFPESAYEMKIRGKGTETSNQLPQELTADKQEVEVPSPEGMLTAEEEPDESPAKGKPTAKEESNAREELNTKEEPTARLQPTLEQPTGESMNNVKIRKHVSDKMASPSDPDKPQSLKYIANRWAARQLEAKSENVPDDSHSYEDRGARKEKSPGQNWEKKATARIKKSPRRNWKQKATARIRKKERRRE